MVRATPLCNIHYKLDFEAAIRVHYIYQSKWTPQLNLKHKCAIDTRDEAVEHDKNAIGVQLWGEEGREVGPIGKLPIEFSKFMKQFLYVDKTTS